MDESRIEGLSRIKVDAVGSASPFLFDSLLVCSDSRAEMARCLREITRVCQGPLPRPCFLAPLTAPEANELSKESEGLGFPQALFGSIVGPYHLVGSCGCTLRCSGNQEAYERILPLLKVIGSPAYVGKSPLMAPLLSNVASGVHYAPLMALLVGAGMCMKYGLDLASYTGKTNEAMPALCQGAYRNIWSGLTDGRTFEDVDDDIHAMEMLVCLLKRTGGAELIEREGDRQTLLNDMLWRHWRSIIDQLLEGGGPSV